MITAYDLVADPAEVGALCKRIKSEIPDGGTTEHCELRLLDRAPKLEAAIMGAMRHHHSDPRCDYYLAKSWGTYQLPGRGRGVWHDHVYAHWAFCYFLRKPLGSGHTIFKIHGQMQEVPAKEGQLLIWPASLDHFVDENKSEHDRFSVAGDVVMLGRPGEFVSEQLPAFQDWKIIK